MSQELGSGPSQKKKKKDPKTPGGTPKIYFSVIATFRNAKFRQVMPNSGERKKNCGEGLTDMARQVLG